MPGEAVRAEASNDVTYRERIGTKTDQLIEFRFVARRNGRVGSNRVIHWMRPFIGIALGCAICVAALGQPPKPAVITDRFPNDTHHGWKFIAFGPDGKLYVPVGAPCNICEPDPERYANITRMNPDGTGFEIYARGVRNTVGFDWDPHS